MVSIGCWQYWFLHLSVYWHSYKKHTNKLFKKLQKPPVALVLPEQWTCGWGSICLYLLYMQHDYRKDVICICPQGCMSICCIYYICMCHIYSTPFPYPYCMYNELCPTLPSNCKLHFYTGRCCTILEKYFLSYPWYDKAT